MNTYERSDGALRARIEAEYREMPGLALTAAQARRLWALDDDCCARLLGVLTAAGFLSCDSDGRYRRNTGGFAGDSCEAFTEIIAAAARADGSVLPAEIDRLEHTMSSLPVFRGRSEETLRDAINRAIHRRPDNPSAVIREAAAALPAALRGTAFAVGVDVLLADGRLLSSEAQFLEELRQLLGVRRSVARKVLGVLGTKNLVWTDARLHA